MDKAWLFANRLPATEVKIEGGVIKVRGLSRAQALYVRTLRDDDVAMERAILHLGVVDPPLTDEEAGEWMDAAPSDEILVILSAIQNLSGLSEGAPKSGVPGVRG